MAVGKTHRVLVLLLPEVHLQDLSGPVQVLYEAAQLGGAYQLSYFAGAPRVRSAQGLELSDLAPLPEVRKGDLVLVPGTASASLSRLTVPRAWLRGALEAGAPPASIRSGAVAPPQSGLLDDPPRTPHLGLVDLPRAPHPPARDLHNCRFS